MAKYRESRAPTVQSIHAIDYSRTLELFESACKVFAVPKGSEALVESHEILFMVSSHADVVAVYGDEESHEEASERISTVPGRDRARGLHENFANSS